jgi:preprotein translocase SecE subunit
VAEEKPKKRRIRQAETVRDKVEKNSAAAEKKPKRRVKSTAGVIAKPFKVFRVLRFIIPPYFRNSWKELKEVTWPGRRETLQLTFAVFMFAIVFGILVGFTDYGLDKVFKRILLK